MENCIIGANYTPPKNTYKRTGYTFNGLNTAADGTGTAYANGAVVTNLAKTGGETVTLYAQWNKVKYTIT